MTAHVDPRRPVEQQLGEDRSLPGGEDETLTAPAADREATAARSELIELGPYLVLKQLGQGGMGTVYLARDTRLNRKLALKVMLPNFAAIPASRERFLREARAAAQISHDNVVTVYEADERDGIPYIAMQYLQGYPLDEYLKKKGNPSIPQVLRIARETVAGLAAAHRLGLVHRDIKPGNLWLEAPGGRIKVLDFGLAKPVKADVELTQHGAVIGTPAYMSPEQARGNRVDARSDLFSLGAVLYRLVTGRLPFRGDTSMAVLMALASEEPLPVRAINPDVPEAFAELIHKLLAKDPSRRLPTADDVAKVLREISNPPVERAAALPVATRVQVVYVPIEVSAEQSESPFEDLEETATAEVEAAPLKRSSSKISRPRPRSRPWPWIAAGLIGLVALAAGAIVIIITNKDGTKTTVEVPDGSKVEIKDNGNTVARVGPKMDDEEKKGTAVAIDADRKAAELALKMEAIVDLDGERQVTSLDQLPKAPFQVVGVNFHKSRLSDASLDILRDLQHLIVLNAVGPITDAGLKKLAEYPLAKTCRHVGLGNSEITDAGLKTLGRFPALKSYSCVGCKFVTGTGLAVLKGEMIEGLDFGASGLTDEGLAVVRSLDFTLRNLSVEDTMITDVGLEHIGKMNLTDLLRIHGCDHITDAGFQHLEGLASLVNLEYSSKSKLSGKTFQSIGKLKSLNVLVAQLSFTNEDLAPLLSLSKLHTLGLSNTTLTDEGLLSLAALSNLKNIYIEKTKVTATGVKKFRAARPKVSVKSDFDADR